MTTLRTSFLTLLFFTLLFGIIYPLFMFGIGQIFFRQEAGGSLVFDSHGNIIGSELIAQNFTKPEYFHPRPSSAGDKGYDAANSSGSNLGPTSQKLIDALHLRSLQYRTENKLAPNAPIPADSVTSSGSGLDPHITIANALLQIPRIAAARYVSERQIKFLVEQSKQGASWGLLGEPRVNVLKLNLALDKIRPTP
ncbi:MAG: potassium-transporting ATPase subunit KdpC [Simkaniaceae bacterium]|nr:potassium-transporting ATPase subunit KdpC [Simkaniaceae bacterium]